MLTKYKIEVIKEEEKRVDIRVEIGNGKFPSFALFTFEDLGVRGIQKTMEEKSGRFVPPEIIEKARKLAIDIMLEKRARRQR